MHFLFFLRLFKSEKMLFHVDRFFHVFGENAQNLRNIDGFAKTVQKVGSCYLPETIVFPRWRLFLL